MCIGCVWVCGVCVGVGGQEGIGAGGTPQDIQINEDMFKFFAIA